MNITIVEHKDYAGRIAYPAITPSITNETVFNAVLDYMKKYAVDYITIAGETSYSTDGTFESLTVIPEEDVRHALAKAYLWRKS